MATPKLESMIRLRAEKELKQRLELLAVRRRKKFPELLREELWRFVDQFPESARPAPKRAS